MSVFYRILIIIVSICIPVILLLSALNIVFRLPDLYVYEFNRVQITSEVDLEITDDELGHFFSDFMKGKEEHFDLFTEFRDREQAVFGAVEQINMENARRLLNYSLFLLGGAAFLLALCYTILLIKKKKYELRGAYKGGILIFTILMILLYSMFYINQTKDFMYQLIFINPFGADDVLPLMLTNRFAQMGLIGISAVGLILLVIMASITWRLTKPRRMFW